MRRLDPAILRLIAFVGGLLGMLVIVILFRRIFLPLFLGLGIAYLFDPVVSWFERHGRSRVFGVVVIAAVFLLGLGGLVFYVVPTIGDQFERLSHRLPQYSRRLQSQFGPGMVHLQLRYAEELRGLEPRLIEALRESLPSVVSALGNWLKHVFSNLLELVLFLFSFIFIPVFAFYLLVDFPKIKRGLSDLIPVPYRDVTLERVREVDQVISTFLRGQLTIVLCLASINAIGLMLLGVPLWLVIGLAAGFANVIPYMALVVGLLPALLLAWAEQQSLWQLVGVVAVLGGGQLLEGTVLSPRILGRSLNLHPVWVLLAVIAGGSLFGFFGMLVAVPAAATIQVFVRHWLKAYRESRIYRGEGIEKDDTLAYKDQSGV